MEIAVLIPSAKERDLMATLATLRAEADKTKALWPQLNWSYWLIDDGADVAVQTAIAQAKAAYADSHVITLSRHFGFAAAIQAGLANVTADWYLIADLAYPAMVQTVPQLVDRAKKGADIVAFSTTYAAKHPIYQWCLLTKTARRALLQAAVRQPFSLELIDWIGFDQQYLLWQGPRPKPTAKAQTPLWLLAVLGGLTCVLALRWPQTLWALCLVQLAVIIWLWNQRSYPQQPTSYVIKTIQR